MILIVVATYFLNPTHQVKLLLTLTTSNISKNITNCEEFCEDSKNSLWFSMFRPWSIVVTINVNKGYHSLSSPFTFFMTFVHCNLFNHANNDIPSSDSMFTPTIGFFMNVSEPNMGCCSHKIYSSRCGCGMYFLTLHIKSSSNTCDDYFSSIDTNTTIVNCCFYRFGSS